MNKTRSITTSTEHLMAVRAVAESTLESIGGGSSVDVYEYDLDSDSGYYLYVISSMVIPKDALGILELAHLINSLGLNCGQLNKYEDYFKTAKSVKKKPSRSEKSGNDVFEIIVSEMSDDPRYNVVRIITDAVVGEDNKPFKEPDDYIQYLKSSTARVVSEMKELNDVVESIIADTLKKQGFEQSECVIYSSDAVEKAVS